MYRVLVIEDDQDIQKRIRDNLLGSLGRDDIELLPAFDADGAEKMLAASPNFDAIVLDGCLSGDRADGAELIPLIREYHPAPKPLIAISKSDTLRSLMVDMGCTHECRKNAVPGLIINILDKTKALR